jgi:hypothetical protein
VPLTWRRADVTASGIVPVEYRTGTPYLGLALDARFAPLRAGWFGAVPAWAEPLEVDGHYSQRFLSSSFTDASGAPASVGSTERRFALDLRYPWTLESRTRLAARLGWAVHHFDIDANPLLPSSTRSGLRLGVDAEHPVLRWASAELQARLYPSMGPGSEERARFGADASGWGYEIAVGASGPLAQVYPGLGWRVTYDFLHFSDSFSGGAPDASGSSSYHSLLFSVTFAR